jgi:hypothetical protein
MTLQSSQLGDWETDTGLSARAPSVVLNGADNLAGNSSSISTANRKREEHLIE